MLIDGVLKVLYQLFLLLLHPLNLLIGKYQLIGVLVPKVEVLLCNLVPLTNLSEQFCLILLSV